MSDVSTFGVWVLGVFLVRRFSPGLVVAWGFVVLSGGARGCFYPSGWFVCGWFYCVSWVVLFRVCGGAGVSCCYLVVLFVGGIPDGVVCGDCLGWSGGYHVF